MARRLGFRFFDPADHPARINLGCGFDKREGFLNVDFAAHHEPDLMADIRDLSMLPTDRYVEVLAYDCLEHLPRTDSMKALAEWFRVTAPGGRLQIRTPNALGTARKLLAAESAAQHRAILHEMYGTQAYTGDYHLTSFTELTLIEDLAGAGFTGIVIEDLDGWNHDVVAFKPGSAVTASPFALSWCNWPYREEDSGGRRWRWTPGSAELLIVNLSDRPESIELAFDAELAPSEGRLAGTAVAPAPPPPGGTDALRIRSPFDITAVISGASPTQIFETRTLPPGPTRVRFECAAPPLVAPGDPRELVWRALDMAIRTGPPPVPGEAAAGGVIPAFAEQRRRTATVAST